jgi:hypothetical protein
VLQFKSTIKKSSSSDQALEPPSQLELHSLEHSYIGLELEGGKHCLVSGSVGDCLVISSLSLLLLHIRSYIIHLVHYYYEFDFGLFYYNGYDFALFAYILNYNVLSLL